MTAAEQGFLLCRTCGLVCRQARLQLLCEARCPRCLSMLHIRKRDSIGRTWAFLIAASILYIPANLLPVMETHTRFRAQENTIMDGVVLFWTAGERFIAAVVFGASVMIPLLKLIAMSFLAVTTQRRSLWRPYQRAKLYRLVERIGRWSMLDVFVVTIAVGLVHIHSIATIHAGIGTTAFGAVVVLTMLASKSFDPRLIWDPMGNGNGDGDAQ